jgi:hypothetical protein
MATESFFSNASLAYLASAGAGKDGKTYSIKPTDGSGDFTFSRGSNLAATRVGPTGLIEKGRENLFTYSNTFSNVAWSKLGVDTPIGGQSGYDGTNDAWKINATANISNVRQTRNQTGLITLSVYAKKGEYDYVGLYFSGDSVGVVFSLIDGGVESPIVAYPDVYTNGESVGNGWFRFSITHNSSSTGIAGIYACETTSYSGNTTFGEGIYIQDAQVEIGLAATDYIESGATTGKAGLLEDEPRFDYSGGATCPSLLLEPSRTQLIPQSEYITIFSNVTPTYNTTDTLSPEGLYNAIKAEATGTLPRVRAEYTASDGVYTLSLFAKKGTSSYLRMRAYDRTNNHEATFDLNDGTYQYETAGVTAHSEDYGNGWYRCAITYTSGISDTGLNYAQAITSSGSTGNVYTYGYQAEAGSYPTSYIPNHSGGSVTRGADVTDRGANLSYMGDYTLFIEFEFTKDAVYLLNSNTSTNYNFFIENDDCYFQFGRTGGDSGSVLFVNKVNWTPLLGTNIKMAFYKSGTNAKLFVNGTPYTPSGNTLSTGNEVLDWRYLNYSTTTDRQQQAYIKQLLEFEEALSDADCIALTS